jgi:hypothetical protein
MKTFKIVGILLAAVVALVIIVGLMLPSSWHVEQSIEIDSPNGTVLPFVLDLKRWQEWTVWTEKQDPSMKREFGGPAIGPGATMSWKGDKMGVGRLVVTSANQDGLKYDLYFDNSEHATKGHIKIVPIGAKTQVTWIDEGDFGLNIFGRFIVPMIKKNVGHDFAQGLANLKTKVETTYAEAAKAAAAAAAASPPTAPTPTAAAPGRPTQPTPKATITTKKAAKAPRQP